MTEEDGNVARLKAAYDEWTRSRGDSACWMALMADEVKVCSLADGAEEMPFTCAMKSKAELETYFDGLARDWEMVSFDMNDFIAQNDRVVAIGTCHWRNRHTNKTVLSPKVDVWRLANGIAVEFSEYYDTARAFAATRP